MPSLNRDQLLEILDRGESVFVRDGAGGLRLVSRRDDLPGDAELARSSGDAGRVAAAREALEARKKAIDAELAALDQPTPTVTPAAAPAPGPIPSLAPAQEPPAPAKPEPAKAPEKAK